MVLENLVVLEFHLYHGHLFDLLQGGIMNYRELKMIVLEILLITACIRLDIYVRR